ncbi:MAG: trigger factor [Defluviitaleaceae bacterium]|nr:trigger factor [Defluviitaleaceae bacterium]
MQVDNIEKNQYKITFEVDAQEFAKGINHSYNKNKGHFNIPGFRKGKAPRQIIEMNHGAEVFFQDAFDFVLPEAYGKAADESGLEIVARPEIDVLEASTDKGVVFVANVYTRPEVGLSSYKGLSYEPVSAFVNDDEINAELEKLQDKNSRIITITDRPIQNDDTVILDFEGFVDGVPFEGGKAEDFELVIGSKMFIDTFEEQLVGLAVGDSKQVNVTFPEEYHAEALKAKPAMFEVTIKEIKSKEMPALDNDFAADVSEFETIEELKDSIRAKLLEAKELQAKNVKEQAVVDQLINAAQIDLPDVMIDERVDQMIRDMANDMQSRGLDMETYFRYTGTNIEALRDNYRNHAEKHVRARLALTEIAKLEGFEASEEEIDAEFDKISAAYNIPKEKLMTIMSDKEKKDIAKDIVVRKALELLVDSAVAQ